jgi:5-methyltetrahydrofolate--homocysteine methyltransferase
MPPTVPPQLLHFARQMRREPSPAEAKLWRCLRDRQLSGYKFRRQRLVPPFIADFCCVQLRLVVELDGDSHADQLAYDARRTQRLEVDGMHVIRFVNDDVRWHLDSVLEEILRECERLDTKPPATSPGTPGEGWGEGPRMLNDASATKRRPSP